MKKKKKNNLRKLLIFQEMELSSPKFKKLLIFQGKLPKPENQTIKQKNLLKVVYYDAFLAFTY